MQQHGKVYVMFGPPEWSSVMAEANQVRPDGVHGEKEGWTRRKANKYTGGLKSL